MIGKNWKLKRVRKSVLIIATLLLTFVGPIIAVQASTGSTSDSSKVPYFPGLPDDTVQYNKTDITPVSEVEQVKAGEPALFCYRNTTMLMNCTQNCDMIFTADPAVTPKIFGFSIDSNQTMTLAINLSKSPLEGAQVMQRTLNFYIGIEPNSTLQLSAQIRLHINQTELSHELNREVNPSRLTWMYWNTTGAEWEKVESYIDQNGYLVCNTDHFSVWTVAEIDDTEEALQYGLNMAYVYAAISLVIVAVLGIGIFTLKKNS